MKAKKKLVRLLMVLMVSISIFSCSDGEDGVDGINGVDGTDGVDGQDGLDGLQGEQGDTGTANVIYSEWMNPGFPPNVVGNDEVESTIAAPQITEEIINSGTILVFGRYSGFGSRIYQLPALIGQKFHQFRLNPAGGEFDLRINTLDGSDIGLNNSLTSVRYVIIPGGVTIDPASSASKSAKDYSSMSYEEIKAQFNIPE
ncbi:hypothetical protein [Aquimarina sp. AU119]|uniref:hypothetical protein n=1 Tax=Aquimarina sp. AU119 TaxID=2108528 RepID=UPI000D685726|nr:hypothetical protein [Aquimarina sp. AU119]